MHPLLLLLISMLMSCDQDYQVVVKEPEVIYEEIEVPVYIEVEVPVGTPTEDVEIWVDSFVQVNAVDGVDIVWVIDTSGSMNTYQTKLLAGIELMMNALPDTGWRLVMISTDPDEATAEQQFPLVPGDSIHDAEDMYDAMNRGPNEKGFDSIYEYIESNPYAATWMRNDAALLVVFVSDEDDQSDIMSSSTDFISWYSGRRFGNVFLASIVMLADDISACEGPGSGSQVGLEYINATSLLFGTIVDICSDDWSPGVSDATTQIEPYESIVLSNTPVPETIRVFVSQSLYNDWYYDQNTNTVHFIVTPSGGALVEVGYVVDTST
jgi:hypothetical protein